MTTIPVHAEIESLLASAQYAEGTQLGSALRLGLSLGGKSASAAVSALEDRAAELFRINGELARKVEIDDEVKEALAAAESALVAAKEDGERLAKDRFFLLTQIHQALGVGQIVGGSKIDLQRVHAQMIREDAGRLAANAKEEKTPTFKVGDKIVCIIKHINLEMGRTYIVQEPCWPDQAPDKVTVTANFGHIGAEDCPFPAKYFVDLATYTNQRAQKEEKP